jgi:DNA invertase Pin-like site-specific DNA recombinase
MKRKRVALYVRVSTDEQNTDAQETALKEYVQRRGWLLHKIYKDKGISGTASSRQASFVALTVFIAKVST